MPAPFLEWLSKHPVFGAIFTALFGFGAGIIGMLYWIGGEPAATDNEQDKTLSKIPIFGNPEEEIEWHEAQAKKKRDLLKRETSYVEWGEKIEEQLRLMREEIQSLKEKQNEVIST